MNNNIQKILNELPTTEINDLNSLKQSINDIKNTVNLLIGVLKKVDTRITSFEQLGESLYKLYEKQGEKVNKINTRLEKYDELARFTIKKIKDFADRLESYGNLSRQLDTFTNQINNFQRYYQDIEIVAKLIRQIKYEETEEEYSPERKEQTEKREKIIERYGKKPIRKSVPPIKPKKTHTPKKGEFRIIE